jgi:hypothetical protein
MTSLSFRKLLPRTSLSRRLVAVLLVMSSLLLVRTAGAQARWQTLDEFLTRGIRLSPQDLAALGRGETIARLLPTGEQQDVAVFGAVQIDVPRSFFVERQRDFARAHRSPNRAQVHRFSEPAVDADAQALEVTNDDLKELRSCKPNDCNFKLPDTDMVRFRSEVGAGGDARARVAAYARQRLVEYVNDYRTRGNAAMAVYDDRGTVHASDALAAMLRDSSYAFSAVPSLGQYLLDYPRSTPVGASQVIFWSLDELPHLRPVVSIMHEIIMSPVELPQTTVIAAKQIYANHYFEAGLEVLAAADRPAASSSGNPTAITVVAVRRYRFDHLPSGGLLNIRGRVANGLKDNVLADLKRLARDTQAEWSSRGR